MTQNGHIANIESFDTMFGTMDTFDEVLPEPVRVSIVEFIPQKAEGTDANGDETIIRVPRSRIATINTYVPMKILHRMMASQGAQGAESPENQQMMISWMIDQVLEVWRLTEPNMTAEKLAEGLSYQKVFGLFGRFFGDLLKQMNTQK